MKIQFDLPNTCTINGMTISVNRAWLDSYGAHLLYGPILQDGVKIGMVRGVEMNYERDCLKVTVEIDDAAVEK